jgi:EmrB/QacA subfamily drug resistance transporter
MAPGSHTLHDDSANKSGLPPRFRTTLFSLLAAVALAALDGNIVATALPTIASELNGLEYISWVVTSFMLAQSATLLLYGKLGDMYGRRPLFLWAVGIFVVGSLLCGIAQSIIQLIVMRAVQGVGAAGILTLSSATLADLVSARARGRYQGYFTGTLAVCSIAGPLVGGGLTTWFGWRSVFLINLPLGLIVFALLWWRLPTSTRRHGHRVDYAGAILIVITTVSGLIALSSISGPPWQSPRVLILAFISLVSLAALVVCERRAREPVLDLHAFRNPVFTRSALSHGIVAFPYFGSAIFLPLYLQLVRGLDPAAAGLAIAPQLLGMMAASIIGGHLVSHIGRYRPFIVAGIGMIGAGLAAIGACMLWVAPLPWFILSMIVLGLGGGLSTPNITLAVQNSASPDRVGSATAFTSFIYSIAASAGMAAFGAMIAARVHGFVVVHADPAQLEMLVHSGIGAGISLPSTARAVVAAAYTDAIGTAFLMGSIIVCIAFFTSMFIPEHDLKTTLRHSTTNSE